jgi:hypothetical protein
MALLTRKSTENAPPGFARQRIGAAWQDKNKDPSRAARASKTASVCFYTRLPARHLCKRLPHNSKCGRIIS